MHQCMDQMMHMMGMGPTTGSSGGGMSAMDGGMAGPSLWMTLIAGVPLWLVVLVVSSALMLVVLAVGIRWWRRRLSQDQRQALRMLQLRLARGEVALDDYHTRMTAILAAPQTARS